MNKQGVLSQPNRIKSESNKKLSPKAKDLLKKINNDLPRYEKIDSLINKIKK